MLYNLREYHRPVDMDEALRLLRRTEVRTVALAGGTDLVGQNNPDVEAVVDLSGLGLDFIEREGNRLRLGATVRLQTIVEELADAADGLLAETARRMAGRNVRHAATLGGTLASRRINSPLSVALAALGAQVTLTGGETETVTWPALSPDRLRGCLITQIAIDLPGGRLGAAYEQVGRTPADLPIVCAAAIAQVVQEGLISTRTVVGGLLADDLVSLDLPVVASNPDIDRIDGIGADAPKTALLSDYLGSAEYRRAVAPVLARRALSSALGRLGISVG